jgi:DNA-binding LacI/PurR family transcriptional regulator
MVDANEIIEQDRTYQRIKQRLRSRLGKQWRVGQRLPPIKQLAQQMKLGQNNTHRAVQDLVAEGLLISTPGRGTYVSDAPGIARPRIGGARGAVAGKRIRVLCAWHKPDRFLQLAIDAAMQALTQAGCEATLATRTRHQPLSEFADGDGILLINPNSSTAMPAGRRPALAIVDTSMDFQIDVTDGYDMVGFDSNHAGVVAGTHLRQAGCKDVCFVGCFEPYDITSASRLMGLARGFGGPIHAKNQLHCGFYMSLEGAKAAARYLELSPRPDGICAASDEVAVGFIHGAASHGLEPIKDYQIIGFDGQELGANQPAGPLTTVKAPMAEMGTLAAELLIDRLLNSTRPPKRVLLAGSLIQGATTRK